MTVNVLITKNGDNTDTFTLRKNKTIVLFQTFSNVNRFTHYIYIYIYIYIYKLERLTTLVYLAYKISRELKILNKEGSYFENILEKTQYLSLIIDTEVK